MNARVAVDVNREMVVELFESAKELSILKGISINDAIDYKVSLYEKHSKSNNEAVAWYLRGEDAKKMII